MTDTFAQIIVDTTVRQQYDSAYKKLPSDLRKKIERTQSDQAKFYQDLPKATKMRQPYSPPSIAVVTAHMIDTLNKDEVNPNSYFYQAEKYKIMFCEAKLISDTLGIDLYPGVAQNSSIDITHLIFRNTVQTEYHELHDYDTTFRINLQQEKSNALTLPATSNKFVLSDTSFIIGKTIYGYADIETDTYFQDTESFKKGYITRRLLFRYYFKFIVTKNST